MDRRRILHLRHKLDPKVLLVALKYSSEEFRLYARSETKLEKHTRQNLDSKSEF